jgi:hypothetical protein
MNVNNNEYVELLLKVDGSFETKFNRISTIKSYLKVQENFQEEIYKREFTKGKT